MTERVDRRLSRILSLNDLHEAGRAHLPHSLFEYVAGASESGTSLNWNREAFARLGFRPKVMRDVSVRNTDADLLGSTWSAPFGVAPMGLAALMAYRGDVALASAAH